MADHVALDKARKTIARLTASGAVETTSKGCAE